MSVGHIVRRRNEEAIRQQWKCFWCEVEMTPVPPGPIPKGTRFPDTMVTLDHLYARGDPRRKVYPKNGERRYVAACRDCNHKRGKAHERSLGLDEIRRRAKRFPGALQKQMQSLPVES